MTAQVPESLTFQGQTFGLFGEPLYPWLNRRRNRKISFKRRNTALGRGYVGHWEITGDRLYMVGIRGTFADGGLVTIGALFPESPDRVFARWLTGELRCPSGRLLAYSHAGYSSIYEQDLFLIFQEGVLVDQRTVKNEPPVSDEFDLMDD